MIADNTTICAVSTPPGRGGIAVIRISGPEAFTISDRIFKPFTGKALFERQSHTVTYGRILQLDDALATVFRSPYSFTGEDTVEISCHGSLFIQQETLKSLIAAGCRMATAGEFTKRAYLNGKLDLSQAEAVGDLIASTSASAHRLAMNQMRGGFSKLLKDLREKLLEFTSLIELELDFSEEDVEFADRSELRRLADEIEHVMSRLVNSFDAANAIKNGIPTVIVGKTNAGKSTLLNCLLHDDRAIVSDIHGTTRDTIEDTVNIHGMTFRFIDTAGIRKTTDSIEKLGIDRSFRKMDEATIIIWVIDSTTSVNIDDDIASYLRTHPEKEVIIAINKMDISSCSKEYEIRDEMSQAFPQASLLPVSAKGGTGIDELEKKLAEVAPQLDEQDVVVTNLRHYEALTAALDDISRVQQALKENIPGDLLAQDIRECIAHLGSITGGEIHSEEVLNNIFKNFCIGK